MGGQPTIRINRMTSTVDGTASGGEALEYSATQTINHAAEIVVAFRKCKVLKKL